MSQAFSIFLKDIRSEIRTRYSLNALLMFVLVVISIIKFSSGDETPDGQLLSGLLWIVIFFSNSTGLAKVFISEEERGTALLLKYISSPDSVYLGKLLYNLIFGLILNLVVTFLFIAVTDMRIMCPAYFYFIIITGNLGIASVLTIIGALISKASSKGALFPVLSFPILLPLMLSCINASSLSADGTDFSSILPDIQLIISYTIVVITASYLLFPIIWKD